jgi:aspartyl-tRNA(Asn)/glutamyl-tRNA(Gln) amidotransferase subunit C
LPRESFFVIAGNDPLLLARRPRLYNREVPDPSSPVDPQVVRKIAALARLAVPESELDLWTEQLGRIVSYIDQLKTLPESGSPTPAAPTPVRPDVPRDGHGRAALEQNAPLLLHDHGVVPRIVGASAGIRRELEGANAASRAAEGVPPDVDAG